MIERRGILILPLALSACGGGDDDRPATFRPIRFDYLAKLRLNVGRVDIEEAWQPPRRPPNVDHLAPTTPSAGLRTMAEDRLLPAATRNRAVFSIRDAAIVERREPGGLIARGSSTLNGRMAVRLEVFEEGSTSRAAFAEARVDRNVTDESAAPRVLDRMVRRMLDDMNVEFEFQIRRALRDWLQPDAPEGAPPSPLPVEQEPLSGRNT